jgi:hypothetical protein
MAAIAAIMVAILAAIFNMVAKTQEIPNIMFVCKFEINWSTNKNLRVLIAYLVRLDGRTD